MNNAAIAQVFQDMADFLELKGENPFKIRAYQKAARAIETLPKELEQVMQEGKLREIPGIGEAISSKITELLTTGRLEAFEKLRAEFPSGVINLITIPGVGPKTALRLSKELGISNVEELEKAILEGKVASLFRLGEKTSDNILRHIQAMRRKDRRILLGEALPLAEEIMAALKKQTGVRNLTPAGSLRRFKETVGDIDIMGTADDPESVIKAFVRLPMVELVLAQGPTKASVIGKNGLQVDLRMMEPDSFGSLLQHFTGSREHNVALRERAVRQGLSLSEYGITVVKTGEVQKFTTEEAFYTRLGLQYIPPELRELQGEIELAEEMGLPKLIELSDIRGDFHVHTEWSDGHDTIETLANRARSHGYSYMAITDHSAGRGIAHGLNEERLKQQFAEIRELSRKLEGIRLFMGIEVDIRADGTLDYPDELLSEIEVVVAAVHSGMGQDKEKMTRRILRALENPHVDILAHPTCRLIGERDPIDFDMEQVLRTALRTNTALEINAMPDRLDLKDIHVLRAKELGVELVISTDSHRAEHFDSMRFGVGVARRGWCEARHVLNTKSLSEVEAFFTHSRHR